MRKQISLHVVTAGVAVSAAFAGIHRNHHFDTIQRLHPLLHPPKYRRRPLHPGIGLDYSSFYEGLQSSLFFLKKKEISTHQGQYLFLLIIIHLSSIKSAN